MIIETKPLVDVCNSCGIRNKNVKNILIGEKDLFSNTVVTGGIRIGLCIDCLGKLDKLVKTMINDFIGG